MAIWELPTHVWQRIRTAMSALFHRPHFSFITIHYFWIIGLTILGSVLLYPAGNLAYIDALFFASGASTQSGLNSVDINSLNTYQQLVLYFLPMLANPITVNTYIVFIRLYWFEKRFQHIVREAVRNRRSISQSRSQAKGERDMGKEERGVDGRQIVVLHPNQANHITDPFKRAELNTTLERKSATTDTAARSFARNSSGDFERGKGDKIKLTEEKEKDDGTIDDRPQIKFAERVKRSDGLNIDRLQLPFKRAECDDLTVLERQRNPKDKGVLRIPGPRDSEMGVAPETVEDEVNEEIDSRPVSVSDSRSGNQQDFPLRAFESHGRQVGSDEVEDMQLNQNVPKHGGDGAHQAHSPPPTTLRLRKPRNQHDGTIHDDDDRFQATRSRTRSLSSANANVLMPYLSWQPTIGRNSAFVDLSQSQREELGGVEYRSLKSLALILVIYFWGFTIMGIIGLLPWIHAVDSYGSIVDADGQSRTWWAFFTASSSFNDVGFTITPDSMVSFQAAIWPLLFMSFLIIIGNTGFPIMLRWVIWITSKLVPEGSGIWEELRFLLDHPRRCFTLLFPSKATWWLFWILVILNSVDLVLFIILDFGNTIVTQLPVNIRILDGWFQAVSTRTAGFSCVNLSALHPAIQVSYLVMMYISVLPIAISVRRTNVYEEKSLGIYGRPAGEEEDETEPSYVAAHLRRQLSFDLWYIFLGVFIISISEGPRIQSGDPNFTMFAVLFEVVSAYGTVGLSLGYAGINASFSAEFGVIAKLVIIAMQVRGRHRGLPYELDRAVLLPSEALHKAEDHDAAARIRRQSLAGSTSETHTSVRRGSNSANRKRGPAIPNSISHSELTISKIDGPSTESKADISQDQVYPYHSRDEEDDIPMKMQ